jgi:acyl carrier protein
MHDDVARIVVSAIAKNKKISPETITLESTLEELRIDSLDGLNLFFDLEEAFDITIPDESARTMRSVGQIVQGLEQLLATRSPSDSADAAKD